MIKLYPDYQLFTNVVFESTKKLIKNGIWPIDPLVYKSWMKNFVSEAEQFFCACLLDSLLFRTEEQVISSYHSIFNQHLPSLQLKFNNEITLKRDLLALLRKEQRAVKLVTVNAKRSAGKSSHVLANILRKKFGIHQNSIIPPEEVSDFYDEGTMLFIFIDDFLGSGHQFKEQLDNSVEKKWDKGVVLYLPLIAHQKGIDFILQEYPNVIVQPVELIARDYCFFTKYFSDEGNSATMCKKFYEDFMNKKGFSAELYGYGDLGVSVAFEHSCPDNTLLAFRGDNRPTYAKLF